MTALGIFGVGAIGGSIGLRARRNGVRVLAYDSNPAALEAALALGAIDATTSAQALPIECDVLVIAAHLEPTLREIERLTAQSSITALVLDVASVKLPVVRAAAGLQNFVATHPMAGTERSGAAAARADLFEGRVWAYVPGGDDALNVRARSFIESMGALPLPISAEAHDRAVAITSHLPQIVAWCYASLLRDGGADAENLCGPVANELLRIAGMSSATWRDILQANASNIEPPLRRLATELQASADALAT